jgi:hypothetical protein
LYAKKAAGLSFLNDFAGEISIMTQFNYFYKMKNKSGVYAG